MPPKKLVRRARKSLRERRMNECLRELTQNFEKVELRKYRGDKARRAAQRKRAGKEAEAPRMSREVLAGIMDEGLFNVERILHARAGLPEPVPLQRQLAQTRAIALKLAATAATGDGNSGNQQQHSSGNGSMQIGLIDFGRFVKVV